MPSKLPPKCRLFKGASPGPTAVIVGSAHGNERIGVKVLHQLAKLLPQQKIHGNVYLVLGNPKAYKANKRYIDVDLNRQFGPVQNVSEKIAYEQKRAQELLPLLQKADYLLDIHSTLKPSYPFVYSKNTQEHRRLARVLTIDYFVYTAPDFYGQNKGLCIDNFVDHSGGIGITYESGWHLDEGKEESVLQATKKFLKTIGIAFHALPDNMKKSFETLMVYDQVIPKTDHFKFTADYANFDDLPAGTLIAMDGKNPVRVKKDSLMIFPKKEIQKGKMACYVAKKIV